MIKKAGIYDPYLDTLGGGERYCLTVVEMLLQQGYQVDIFWSGDQNLLTKAQERFNLNLQDARFVADIFDVVPQKIDCVEDVSSLNIITKHHLTSGYAHKIKSLINKVKITRQYDLFFYISDWSVPLLFSKNNLLHVQVPFVQENSVFQNVANRLKTMFHRRIICNSQFTKNFASARFGSKCITVYPPVDVEKFHSSSQKENIILSVGRFDNLLNSKKQDILIDAFKKLHTQHPDWKLVLAGGSFDTPEKNSYLNHLHTLTGKLPVTFIINPDFKDLADIYSRSKIYWHAAGYGVDETLHPENTEHFGIAPVEAMASGSVPLVVKKGGLPEIVQEGKTGYLWENIDDLVAKTSLLIKSPQLLKEMSADCQTRSQIFSKTKFVQNLQSLL